MSTDERSARWYTQHAEEYTKHVRNPDESIYHSLYEKPAMYELLRTCRVKLSLASVAVAARTATTGAARRRQRDWYRYVRAAD